MQHLQKSLPAAFFRDQIRRPFSKAAGSFLLASTVLMQAKEAAAICCTNGVRWDRVAITQPKGGSYAEPSVFTETLQAFGYVLAAFAGAAVAAFLATHIINDIENRLAIRRNRKVENPNKGI